MRVITVVCSMSAINWSRPPPLDFARGGLSFVEGQDGEPPEKRHRIERDNGRAVRPAVPQRHQHPAISRHRQPIGGHWGALHIPTHLLQAHPLTSRHARGVS